jgi:hypothetical protein
MDSAVGDDVQSGDFLIPGDGRNGIFERLAIHGIRRFLVAGEMTPPGRVPPTWVRIVPDHAGGNKNLLTSNFHLLPPLLGLIGPCLISVEIYLCYPYYVNAILSYP